MNPDFEALLKSNCNKKVLSTTVALIATGALTFFLLFWAIKLGFTPLYLLVSLFGIGLVVLLLKLVNDLSLEKKWVALIRDNPEEVVWIKPIITSHNVALVITIYKEKKFQLKCLDGSRLTLECNSDHEQNIFFEAVRTHLPHAHLGYSQEIEGIYNEDARNFINTLTERELFTPIGVLEESNF